MKHGFTLVELSIVLVIIGLLIGGILAAQSMIETTRVQKVIREEQQYQIIVDNFGTKYNAVPGDAPTFTPAGNGDGLIYGGVDTLSNRLESPNFWVHLKQAGMLQNCICDGGGPTDGSSRATTTTPPSVYTNGARWGVGNHTSGVAYFHLAKTTVNYFMLTSGPAEDYILTPGTAIIKPANALAIDTKIDDGNPLTGEVLGTNDLGNGGFGDQSAPSITNLNCLYSTNPYANPAVLSSWSYNTAYTNDQYGCNMAFEMKKNW